MMRRLMISVAAAALLLLTSGARSPQASGDLPNEMTSLEDLLAEDCADDVAQGIAQAAARLPQAGVPTARTQRGGVEEGGVASDEWPPNAITAASGRT